MANTAQIVNFPPVEIRQQETTPGGDVASLSDGYTRLANQLLDAAIGFDMSKRQYKIFLAIVRKTYGYQKKRDRISGSQLSSLTTLPRARCSEVLNELIALNIVIRTGGAQGELEINKNTKEWVSPEKKKCHRNSTSKKPKQNSTETVTLSSTETVTHASTETVHTKETLKDNTKDNELANANSCAELTSSAPPIAWLPTNKSGESYPITQEQVNEWQQTYPAVDVMNHLRQMYSWSNANPKRRKTKQGMARFIVNWLSREQDRGGSYRNSQSQRRPVNVMQELQQLSEQLGDTPMLADDQEV